MLAIIMELSVLDKNTPNNITFAFFHQYRLARYKKTCVTHFVQKQFIFLYFVQFHLLKLQRFCFQCNSCHSFNTSSFLCEYRINYFIEFITGQKFVGSFSSHRVLYIEGVKTKFGLWSFLIIFAKHPTNSGLTI